MYLLSTEYIKHSLQILPSQMFVTSVNFLNKPWELVQTHGPIYHPINYCPEIEHIFWNMNSISQGFDMLDFFNAKVLLTDQLLVCNWDKFSFTPEIHVNMISYGIHRFQRCVCHYFAIWLFKQLSEIGEADTFIFFLCTWKQK